MLPTWLFELEEEDEEKKASTAAEEYVLDFSLDVSKIEHDAGAPHELSSEWSEDVDDDDNDGESKSDDHGDVPMPLEPDEPYRDLDAILDYGTDKKSKKSFSIWSFFSCCLE